MTFTDACNDVQVQALESLGRTLLRHRYRFTTITPESHRRYLKRRTGKEGNPLRNAFGWNLPIDEAALPDDVRGAAHEASVFVGVGSELKSRVRFSTIGESLYVHSAYPTVESNAVFFGPDTYRFVSMIEREIPALSNVRRVVDIGCGSGAGGLEAICCLIGRGQIPHLEMTDINPLALRYAAVNARLAGIDAQLRQADLYADMEPGADLIVANPPYLIDPRGRAYRHGGGSFGAALSERIVLEGLPMLARGGSLLLYTGSVIVDGHDLFFESLRPKLQRSRVDFRYAEIDPDVFGEELDHADYAGADRIAVVSLVVKAASEKA